MLQLLCLMRKAFFRQSNERIDGIHQAEEKCLLFGAEVCWCTPWIIDCCFNKLCMLCFVFLWCCNDHITLLITAFILLEQTYKQNQTLCLCFSIEINQLKSQSDLMKF